MTYADFLASKRIEDKPSGMEPGPLSDALFPFQQRIVQWALRRGRAAIFADCGLGKTPMQLEWARHVAEHTGKPVLILAPLAVSAQTVREGEKFGIEVERIDAGWTLGPVAVTNYERLHHFRPQDWGGVVLDESSILKAFDGKTRRALQAFGQQIPFRLACTATPAPNDHAELGQHAEFLGVMGGLEMLALFFTQDGNTTHKWRLKGHAQQPFWQWLASWCVALRRPSDLGFSDDGFELPPLCFDQVTVGDPDDNGFALFGGEARTLAERRAARKASLPARVAACAEMVNADAEQWLVWCDLNAESEALTKAIPGAVEIRGSDTAEHKERAMLDFAAGSVRVLVTKPSIAGFGMNWQNCARMTFVGLSDSYEQLYQAVRRCWRFGQTREVMAYVFASAAEGAVVRNVDRKEAEHRKMMEELVIHMGELSGGRAERAEATYERDERVGSGWRMLLGDSVERIADVPDESVGLTVFSPPFPGMYAYTNSPRDMGNVTSMREMIQQFRYLIPGLLRVTMPGRSCAIHLCQGLAQKGRDGYIGVKDFRGAVIEAMQDAGWIYYGEVCIDKDPQVKAIRTKDRGLLFKTLATDSAHMHMALADYLLQFRKPGDNPAPIPSGVSEKYGNRDGWITPEEWIEWAAPVWYRAGENYPGGIRETDVLNVRQARDTDDERHLCPLQLGVIERAVKLWTNPGETVLSPFAGIGSEGVGALRLRRRFVGVELKRSYFESACENLTAAEGQQEMLL